MSIYYVHIGGAVLCLPCGCVNNSVCDRSDSVFLKFTPQN